MGYRIEDFAFDLRKSTAPPEHIWVNSGFSTVAPLADTVFGVEGCYSPPFAAGDLRLDAQLRANGREIADTGDTGKGDCGLLVAGAEWLPDRIKRKGTYHWLGEEGMLSLAVRSELVPLADRAGFLLTAYVGNRSGKSISVSLKPVVRPGRPHLIPLDNWQFGKWEGEEETVRLAESVWENGQVRITLLAETIEAESLEPEEEAVFRLAVVLTSSGEDAAAAGSLEAWEAAARAAWEKRIDRANDRLPRLVSDIPGLEAYYRRSLISGLVCEWENPNFVTMPFIATCGMDGGGICAYLWDNAGYAGQAVSLMLGEQAAEQARRMAAVDMNEYYCFTLAGTGKGVWYSYSLWSFFNFVWSLVTQHGVGAEEFYPVLKQRLLSDERRLPETGGLLDYGEQHNLLEMRGSGYEHVVASPNAERAWCYDRLADLAEHLGEQGAEEWRKKAESIRSAIRERLWDEENGWFASLYPNGHRELIYSIQVLNTLRMNVCTPKMKEAILSHVRDGAFLGDYGVTSVSAEDERHYELLDPDWSGGGSYTGSGPNLAQMLWEADRPELAWDVLKRLFWMGRHLPYYPQEHYSDRPLSPGHKRANIISGICGMQAVVYGMAGFEPRLDGSLWIHPKPPRDGTATISGYPHRGRRIDVQMAPGECKILCDGVTVYSGAPRPWKVVG